MDTKDEIIKRASCVLIKIHQDYKDKGLLSIYLWGSIITPDFSSDTSDIDAVGFLSDKANFPELDQIREWLPKLDPGLKRLQINFLYLTELKGTGTVRSRLARLEDAEQAVFDFPYWLYVCGERYSVHDFPKVTPQQALAHQVRLTETRREWAAKPSKHFGPIGLQYYCKSLAWLCYCIQKLSSPAGPFSWTKLKQETTDDTKELVENLIKLKTVNWDEKYLKSELPFLLTQADRLVKKYS